MKKQLMLLTLLAVPAVYAGQYATALGNCIYSNTGTADRTTLTQWAFVTIGKTDAARAVTRISDAKIEQVNKAATSLLCKLAVKTCRSEVLKVIAHEPKTGAQDAMTDVAVRLVKNQISSSASKVFGSSVLGSSTLDSASFQEIKNLGSSLKSLLTH